MVGSASSAALLTLCLALCCATSANADKRRVEIRTQAELVTALNDEGVDHIVFMPVPWNFTDEELPMHAAVVRRRTVLLEGAPQPGGKRLYIDGNQLTQRVLVTDGAELTQRNLWVDDCVLPVMPFNCFTDTETEGGGARITLENVELSDASCTRIRDSKGASTMVFAAQYAQAMNVKIRQVDERSLVVGDTGWVPYVPATAFWRMINVTFSCTGNVTHALPPSGEAPENMSGVVLRVAIAVAMLIATVLYWTKSKASVAAAMGPAYRIAREKGFELIEVLGSGRFGKVYRARQLAGGREVAVKVLQLQATNWRQLRAAWRECQIMGSVAHPSCVRVVTYYSARLAHAAYDTVAGTADSGYLEHHLEVTKVLDRIVNNPNAPPDAIAAAEGLILGGRSGRVRSSLDIQPPATPLEGSEPGPFGGSGSGGSGQPGAGAGAGAPSAFSSGAGGSGYSAPSSGGWSAASETIRGTLVLQVHLVMEYADRQTLAAAVHHGRFTLPNGRPNTPWMVDTALDVARGLAFLHGPAHRLVHRDLSPANVLLTSAPTPRGFRALLSDFGLSTVLALDATHRTSEMKGTIAYMPPEVFESDAVSIQLDVYSLGVLLCFVLTGADPYHSMSPSALIRAKLNAGDEQVSLPRWVARSTNRQVAGLADLVRRCTRFHRKERPTADEVVEALEALL